MVSYSPPIPISRAPQWPEMIDPSKSSDGSFVTLHRRDAGVGSHERPKNLWTRAEALRKRLRYARRHIH